VPSGHRPAAEVLVIQMPARSKVQSLPKAVRDWLDQALLEGNFGGYEQLAAELQQRGYSISKSGLHRYGQRLAQKLVAIQASTEAARAIAAAAPDEQDERSAAVISLVQSELFDAMVSLQEASSVPEEDKPKRIALLSKAARSIAEVSRASVHQKRWAEQVRERLQAATEEAKDVGRRGGLSDEALAEIERILTGGV